MKKILLSFVVLIFSISFVNAQSFALKWNDESYYSGDTIHFETGSYPVTEMAFNPVFENNTNNGVNVEVIRAELLILEGTINYFCWDTCYQPSVDTSANSMFIPAGSSSIEGDFVGYYETNGVDGFSLIEYKFYNKDNLDEYISVVVQFDNSPAGVNENIFKNIWLSDVYPNPATNFVVIDYRLPQEVLSANVKVVNIFGSIVKEQNIDTRNNNMRMDITDMNSGIYFYSLFVNGEIYSTKKLIVR